MTDNVASKGGRRRTGTLLPAGAFEDGTPRFRFRVCLADGTKSQRFDVDHGLDERQARALVATMQALEDAHGGLLGKKHDEARRLAHASGLACDGESCDAWHARFLTSRVGFVGNVKDSRGRWRKWVSPHIGPKQVALVTRDDARSFCGTTWHLPG